MINRNLKNIALFAFLVTIQISVIIFITISRSKPRDSAVFKRPHEQHKIKTKPFSEYFPLEELEENDYKKLVDLSEFNFVNTYEMQCGSSDVFLLVLVKSGVKNKAKRTNIRKTWADKYEGVKYFFMLGVAEEEQAEKELEAENRLYGDIVQGNFIDTYRNLTYKTVMNLKYVIYHCPQALYLLKVDDDSFVRMPMILNFLKNDISPFGAQDFFVCNDMTFSPVIRDPNSPWYVSVEDFPDEFYPSYCSGWYTLFSSDVCFKLYKESQKLRYLSVDDALVYGIAAAKANVSHVDFSYYTMVNRNLELLFNGSVDGVPIMLGTPNMNTDMIEKTYKYFIDKPVPLSIHS